MVSRVILGGLALVGVVFALWFVINTLGTGPTGVACTEEAKQCPDGSYVARTGPACEFAACPLPNAMTTVHLGETATIHGTTITALELLEDSRCPVDVQCIQAGTVRLRAAIDAYNRDFIFTLLQPQTVGNATVLLSSVIPAERRSTETVASSDYRFTFTVTPIQSSTANSRIRGTVLLGPTCPVMRDPPDPQCADKPYATAIRVYRLGSTDVFVSQQSAANGTFEIAVPEGRYTVTASGGTVLPRCAPIEVTVGATPVTANISCDTGIR